MGEQKTRQIITKELFMSRYSSLVLSSTKYRFCVETGHEKTC